MSIRKIRLGKKSRTKFRSVFIPEPGQTACLLKGDGAFEARIGPMLRYGGISSHRTLIWNEPYEPSKCIIVALVDAKTGTGIYSAMAGVSHIRNDSAAAAAVLQKES